MNSKDYRNIREAYLDVYEQEEVLDEITGGKGHPGYKAGSRDLGPMQSGHPADSSKRTMKGGTMSMRHGDHLGDLDDNDDDDDDGLEAGLKDSAKKSRENVRKPLRNMVKTAAKRLNKESYDLYDIILSHLLDEGYADTQEAAERIMVNMSEDWRESIVEQGLDPDAPGNTHSLADLHNALKKYEDKKNAAKSPKPGGSGSAGKVKENNK